MALLDTMQECLNRLGISEQVVKHTMAEGSVVTCGCVSDILWDKKEAGRHTEDLNESESREVSWSRKAALPATADSYFKSILGEMGGKHKVVTRCEDSTGVKAEVMTALKGSSFTKGPPQCHDNSVAPHQEVVVLPRSPSPCTPSPSNCLLLT